MTTVAITIDNVDYTSLVHFPTARFHSQVNGVAGEAYIRIRDEDRSLSFNPGQELLLKIDGQAVWRGFVTKWNRTYIAPALNIPDFGLTRVIDLVGVDINILFTRRIVFNQSTPANVKAPLYGPNTADTTAIADLVADWLDLSGDGIDTSSLVEHVGNINVDQKARAWEGSDTWGQAMMSIASLPAAIYYIDPDKNLVFTDVDTPNAPYFMTDENFGFVFPDQAGYSNMEILLDGSIMINDLFAWGFGYGSTVPVFVREQDQTSMDDHNVWQASSLNYGVYKQATINRIAESIVFGSPQSKRGHKDDKESVMVTTYTPGFLPAQKINFSSEVFRYYDTIPIRKMEVTFEAPTAPKFRLTLSHEIDSEFRFFDPFIFNLNLPRLTPPPLPPGFPQPPTGTCNDNFCDGDRSIYDNFNRATNVASPSDDWNETDGWGIPSSGPAANPPSNSFWSSGGGTFPATYCDGSRAVVPFDVGAGKDDLTPFVGSSSFVNPVSPWNESFIAEVTFEYDTAVPSGSFDFIQYQMQVTSSSGSMTCTLYISDTDSEPSLLEVANGLFGSTQVEVDRPPPNVPFYLKWESTVSGRNQAKVWSVTDPEPDWLVTQTDSTGIIGQSKQFKIPMSTSFDHITYVDDLAFTVDLCDDIQFDNFNRTVAPNGWGIATNGGAWTSLSGNAAYSVDGSLGQMVLANVLGTRTLGWNVSDGITDTPWMVNGIPRAFTGRAQFRLTSIPTAGFIQFQLQPGEQGPIVRMFSAASGAGFGVQLSRHDGSGTIASGVALTANTFYVLEIVYAAGSYTARILNLDGSVFLGDVTWSADPESTLLVAVGLNSGSATTRTLQIDYIDFDYSGKPCYVDCQSVVNIYDEFLRTTTNGWGQVSSTPPGTIFPTWNAGDANIYCDGSNGVIHTERPSVPARISTLPFGLSLAHADVLSILSVSRNLGSGDAVTIFVGQTGVTLTITSSTITLASTVDSDSISNTFDIVTFATNFRVVVDRNQTATLTVWQGSEPSEPDVTINVGGSEAYEQINVRLDCGSGQPALDLFYDDMFINGSECTPAVSGGIATDPQGRGCEVASRISSTVYETSQDFVPISTIAYIDGLLQRRGVDYTETGTNQITFTTGVSSSSSVRICYYIASSP